MEEYVSREEVLCRHCRCSSPSVRIILQNLLYAGNQTWRHKSCLCACCKGRIPRPTELYFPSTQVSKLAEKLEEKRYFVSHLQNRTDVTPQCNIIMRKKKKNYKVYQRYEKKKLIGIVQMTTGHPTVSPPGLSCCVLIKNNIELQIFLFLIKIFHIKIITVTSLYILSVVT